MVIGNQMVRDALNRDTHGHFHEAFGFEPIRVDEQTDELSLNLWWRVALLKATTVSI